MPKHIFFDLDGTLTRSRTMMAPSHQELFKKLCEENDVIVITGGQVSQIQKQVPPELKEFYIALSQSGNHAEDKTGTVIWSEKFNVEQERTVLEIIKNVHDEIKLPVKDEADLIEHRGSQITYSLIGHHDEVSKKEAFDPGAKKRLAILASHAADVERLRLVNIDVRPGGTTSLDFTLGGQHKGFNVARLIEHEGWKKEDCVYVGDALFPGGNDETVVGVIPTRAVTGPEETFEFVKKLLK